MHQTKSTDHIPVLLDKIMEYLAPKKGETYLDLTAGYGGHASAVIRITKSPAVLLDRDIQAVKYLTEKFKTQQATIVHSDFLSACRRFKQEGQSFDLILADLGVSSPHFNTASRGFSFKPGPLDMRMDQSQVLLAADIVNNYDTAALTKVIAEYGEEPKAGRVAEAIVAS